MASFMQEQVTAKQTWVEIDGTHGITFVPFDVLSSEQVNVVTETKYDVSEATLNETLGDYYEGTIQSVSLRIGYGARLSAPGYMDCTEWTVFDTETQAQEYLTETYGEEEEEEESDEVEE